MIEQHFYFNFREETGEIWKLTNECDNSTPYVEVDKNTYSEFASEKKQMNQYVVVPSGDKDLKYEIVPKMKDLLTFDVDKSIHQIKKVKSVETNNAFIIEQDTKKGSWFITVTPELKVLLTQTTFYKEKVHFVYITQADDPNVLLGTLEIPLWKVLYDNGCLLDNLSKEVAQKADVSLYCGKIFDNYVHVVK